MGVTIGGGTPWTANGNSGSASCTLTAPTMTGSDKALVLVAIQNSAGILTFSSATYNGADISAYLIENGHSNYTQLSVWVIPNPVSGATFSVTYGSAPAAIVLMAVYVNGAHQTTPSRTHAAANDPEPAASPATVNVTNAEVGDLILGIASVNDTNVTDGFTSARVGAGQTFVGQYAEATDQAQGAVCTQDGATGTVVIDWAYALTTGWRIVAVPLVSAITAYGTPYDHSGVKPYSSLWRPARA